MSHTLIRALLCIAIPCNMLAQGKTESSLDSYFNALHKTNRFNGNILVAENGKIIYKKSFGYSDISSEKPNTDNTVFPVASITKTVTATAILQLQEKGKLDIDDRYARYFPSFPYPDLTIKQLLSHTSRLPSAAFYRFLETLIEKTPDTFFVNNDVIPAFIAMNTPLLPKAEPGKSDFAYSNVNYYLLAVLIEKLSGLYYSNYVKKYIFLPAGMHRSGFSDFYFGADTNMATEHRYRYMYSKGPERIDTISSFQVIFRSYNFKGHGEMITTTGDLLKYDQALYNGKLLKDASLLLAYEALTPGTPGNSGYALGWSVAHDSTNGKIVQHHGGGIGIQTMLIRNLKKKQVVILCDNMANGSFTIAHNAYRILNGEKITSPKISAAHMYGQAIYYEGIPAARKLFPKLQADSSKYEISEYEMNLLAYQLLWDNINDKALEIFELDVKLFPDSWNMYDSYGEGLMKVGRNKEAIAMYQKSIELNPDNDGGKKALEALLKK